MIGPGVYNENVVVDRSISLIAASFDAADPRNNTTILDGGGGTVISVKAGIAPGPSFTGLVVRNGLDGVLVRSAISLESSYLTGNVDSVQSVSGGAGTISDNVFTASTDDAIDINHPTRDLTIEGNELLQSSGDGIEIRLTDDAIASTADVVIRDNRIVASRADGIQFIDYYQDTNRIFTIDGNLIKDSGKAAIGMTDNAESGEDFRAASIRERIHVFNNTFVNNDHGISGGDNLIALNNIFQGHVLALKNVDADSIASYNLFWDNGTNHQGSSVDQATSRFADPLLDGNDRLGPGSPAIDAGIAHFEWRGEVVLDRAASSYNGAAPDLGWLEREGATSQPPSISGFSPTSGAPGSSVTINGSGFTGATAVRFNGLSATFSVVSDTQITATVPSGASTGPIRVTGPAGSSTSAASFTVSASVVTVTVKDYLFKPAILQAAQGQVVRWVFKGPSAHTATESIGLGSGGAPMFDSGSRATGTTYEYRFDAAGTYPYASTNSGPSPMTGSIKVPLVVSPASGATITSFTVRFSASTLAGFRFTGQYRFRPQSSVPWSKWASLGPAQTSPTATFTPDQGAGAYQFRSRLQNEATGRTTLYSLPVSISVT